MAALMTIVAYLSRFIELFSHLTTIGKFIVGIIVCCTGVAATTYVVGSGAPNAVALLTTIQEQANLDTIQATYDVSVSAGIIDGFRGMYSYSGTYDGVGEITAGIDLSEFEEGDIVKRLFHIS